MEFELIMLRRVRLTYSIARLRKGDGQPEALRDSNAWNSSVPRRLCITNGKELQGGRSISRTAHLRGSFARPNGTLMGSRARFDFSAGR